MNYMARKSSGGPRKPQNQGTRRLKTRVQSAKGRTLASTRWLQRQLNDPYVVSAGEQGLRSRAAFKLLQIDDRFALLRPGLRVLDLGAAPGGWSVVAARRVGAAMDRSKSGHVVAVDLSEMVPINGVTILQLDFTAPEAPELIRRELVDGAADLVLSDMAAPATGHRQTDHLRIMSLCEAALEFAREVLAPEGAFLAKVLQGGTESALLKDLKRDFRTVKHVKPDASRADSTELFVLATGFRGTP